jgi:hypothetical protein
VIIWASWSPLAMISWVSPEGTKDMMIGLSSVPSFDPPHPASIMAINTNRTSATSLTFFLILLSFPLFDDWNSTTRKQSPTAKLLVRLSPTSFADDMNKLDRDQ